MARIVCATIHDKSYNMVLNYYNLKNVPFLAKLTVKGELNIFINNIVKNQVTEDILHKLVIDENIELNGFKLSGYIHSGPKYICTLILNGYYDIKEIYSWIDRVTGIGGIEKFYKLVTDLEDLLVEDKLCVIQEDLNKIKTVLYEATANLLDRGDRLDELIVKSEDLGSITRTFKNDTRKLRSCCIIL